MTKKVEGICRYCGQYKELCSAHIIPKSFYCLKQLKSDDRLIGIDQQGAINSTYYQNGIKDNTILCSECDRRLGEYDKYAKEILFDVLPKHKFPDTQIFLLRPDNYKFDYQKLRYFFISLVWRASISNSGDSNISLGKYEDIALKILKGEIPDNPDLFCPIVYKRTKNYRYKDITMITYSIHEKQYTSIFTFPGYRLQIFTNDNNKELQFFLNETNFIVPESDEESPNIIQGIDLTIKHKNQLNHG